MYSSCYIHHCFLRSQEGFQVFQTVPLKFKVEFFITSLMKLKKVHIIQYQSLFINLTFFSLLKALLDFIVCTVIAQHKNGSFFYQN